MAEIYCLWGSCKKFDLEKLELCGHDDYICVDMNLTAESITIDLEPGMLTLEEAKKKYPNVKFCEDWIKKEET